MRKSSGVGTESADKVKCVANMVFSSSLFTRAMNFEALANFRSKILSSGSFLLLSSSRSSKSCRWTHQKQFSKMSKVLRALSRSFVLFVITQLMAVPSKLLVSALHSCFLERIFSSKCNFITSIQVSTQPSDSTLYDFERSPQGTDRCFESTGLVISLLACNFASASSSLKASWPC